MLGNLWDFSSWTANLSVPRLKASLLGLVIPELLKGLLVVHTGYGGVRKCFFTQQNFKGIPLLSHCGGVILCALPLFGQLGTTNQCSLFSGVSLPVPSAPLYSYTGSALKTAISTLKKKCTFTQSSLMIFSLFPWPNLPPTLHRWICIWIHWLRPLVFVYI